MTVTLIHNNMLFLIPSWSKFLGLGSESNGQYLNKDVLAIQSDPVVFFGGLECTIITPLRKLHFIFGQGYYYVRFEIDKGIYTVDKRKLTGLILSDFAYNYMQRSPDIALEKDLDVIVKEHVAKIPIDLSNKQEKQLSFIKGSILRNVFIPRKEIILEILQTMQQEQMFLINKSGHQLLSTYRLHYNYILVSDQLQNQAFNSYLDTIPGLNKTAFGADQLLRSYFMPDDLTTISDTISKLEQVFATLEYDSMSLFSTLEKIGEKLESTLGESQFYIEQKIRNGDTDFLLHSANYPVGTIIEWPSEFERILSNSSTSTPISSPQTDHDSYDSDLGDYRQGPVEITEKFELKILKQKPVIYKPLHPIPKGDMEVVLAYVKDIVESDNFNCYQVGDACEQAWNAIRNMVLHSDFNWELSTLANYYHKQEANLGLSERDKKDILVKLNSWIGGLKKEKALEQEFLDRERREQEKALEKEKKIQFKREAADLERLKQENANLERLNQEKIELERLEQEKADLSPSKQTATVIDPVEKRPSEPTPMVQPILEEIHTPTLSNKEQLLEQEKTHLFKLFVEIDGLKETIQKIKGLQKKLKSLEKEKKSVKKKIKKLEK